MTPSVSDDLMDLSDIDNDEKQDDLDADAVDMTFEQELEELFSEDLDTPDDDSIANDKVLSLDDLVDEEDNEDDLSLDEISNDIPADTTTETEEERDILEDMGDDEILLLDDIAEADDNDAPLILDDLVLEDDENEDALMLNDVVEDKTDDIDALLNEVAEVDQVETDAPEQTADDVEALDLTDLASDGNEVDLDEVGLDDMDEDDLDVDALLGEDSTSPEPALADTADDSDDGLDILADFPEDLAADQNDNLEDLPLDFTDDLKDNELLDATSNESDLDEFSIDLVDEDATMDIDPTELNLGNDTLDHAENIDELLDDVDLDVDTLLTEIETDKPQPMQDVDEAPTGNAELADRMTAIENRLDQMEEIIQNEVARTAAQIIREEIAALAGELED